MPVNFRMVVRFVIGDWRLHPRSRPASENSSVGAPRADLRRLYLLSRARISVNRPKEGFSIIGPTALGDCSGAQKVRRQ